MLTAFLYSIAAVVELTTASRPARYGRPIQGSDLNVSTSSGRVRGIVNPALPHVRQFFGIPYAQPPVGDLRWSAPQPLVQRQAEIEATSLPPSCMQYFSTVFPNTFSQEVLEYNVQGINGTPTAISEDCLTLSIWTPLLLERSRASGGARHAHARGLPVLLFIYGGGFGSGGIDIPYYIPAQWVERTQHHLVVTFNYRLNIFGFPNAAGLDQQNLGLLDQRLVVEWLRENVAAFGGDPERIVLWGQSAGALSVDYYTFAYPEDPVVTGLIMDSGTAQTPFTSTDFEQTNFTFVAENVGCADFGTDSGAEMACMKKVEAGRIEDFIANYQGYEKTPGIAFVPVVDERIVFGNYTARGLEGKQANIPAIVGTNDRDGVIFANYRPYSPSGKFSDALDQLSYLSLFLCPQTETTRVRQQTGLDTYVYLYSGNFSNLSPKPWMGAYHSSELPMLMGTHPNYRGPSSQLEYATSDAMQDAWVAFAGDPKTGLRDQRWSEYVQLRDGNVRGFGAGTPAKDVSIADVEALCDGAGPAT